MVLKEAFTYQNVLTTWLNRVISMLQDTNYTIVTKQEHRRDKTKSANAADWTMETVQPIKEYDITAERLLVLLEDIVLEKTELAKAIDVCKHSTPVSMDVLVEQNKLRSRVQSVLQYLGNLKSSEREFFSTDFTFNVNGDQVSYRYPVREVTTIDFPRKKVKGMQKKYTEEAASVSLDIDKMQLSLELKDFVPHWHTTTTIDDIIEEYRDKDVTAADEKN